MDVSLFCWGRQCAKRVARVSWLPSMRGSEKRQLQNPQNINHHALSTTANPTANHANAASRRGHAA